jgi:hypothetical protein
MNSHVEVADVNIKNDSLTVLKHNYLSIHVFSNRIPTGRYEEIGITN